MSTSTRSPEPRRRGIWDLMPSYSVQRNLPGTGEDGQIPLGVIHRNLIMGLCEPLLDFVSGLSGRFERDEGLPPDVVRNEFKEKLTALETRLLEHPAYHERLDMVKYIMTALIDEVVIFSSWRHAEGWRANPLELELFGKNVAGEHFFELLENYGYKDPELAELFYVCLCLGFDRKVVTEREYKRRLYAMIPDRVPDYDRCLSPAIASSAPMFGLMALTIVLFVSAAAYFTANQMLWSEASEFIHDLSQLITRG